MTTDEKQIKGKASLKDFLYGKRPFSQEAFQSVPSCFAVVYTWVWNTKITEEGIREKIDVMRENKIRAFYILPMPPEFRPKTMITRLEPAYLSDEFFALVRYAVSYAEQNDMVCWLYDEGGWPSGSACGRIDADWHSPECTRAFIDSTYVPYAKALRGCRPELMFTDEPKAKMPTDKGFEAAAEAFTASLKAAADFCHANGWLFGGHLDNDHRSAGARRHGYGSALQCLQTMDIPGIDAIAWQIASGESECSGWDGDMPFFPRFASSAAAQSGRALALSENFAVYGNGVSPDEMRWIIGSQIVRGIDLLNFMLMPFNDEAWFLFQERTVFSPAMPGFGHLHALTAEFERAAYFMAHGQPTTDTAIIFPDRELWGDSEEDKNTVAAFCRLGAELEAQGIDFDVVDEKTLARAEQKNGTVTVGLACYSRLLTVPGQKLDAGTADCIRSVTGESKPLVSAEHPSVWHKVRRDEKGDLFICLFNADSKPVTSRVHIASERPVYRMDAGSGESTVFENGSEVTLVMGEMLLLYATRDIIRLSRQTAPGKQTEASPVCMQKKKELVLSRAGARLVDCRESPIAVNGDFSAAFGEAFSGEVIYKYTFTAEKACRIRISVQKSEDTAEVELNGKTVGFFTTSPYSLEAAARRGENELIITVANPAANAFSHFEADRYFTPAQLGPYHERTLRYESKNCRGGLLGPVTVQPIGSDDGE